MVRIENIAFLVLTVGNAASAWLDNALRSPRLRTVAVCIAILGCLSGSLLGACTDDDSEAQHDASSDSTKADAGTTVDASVPMDGPPTIDAASIDAASIDADLRTGSASFSWTVNGQSSGSSCPISANVVVEALSGPGAQASQIRPCLTGFATLIGLPPGDYVFQATLVDSGQSVVVNNIVATVLADEVTVVASFDFPFVPSTGAASFTWTIEQGLKGCPPNSTITTSVLSGPTAFMPAVTDCNSQPLQVPALEPGQYQFRLVLDAPLTVQSTEVTSALTDVAAGMTSELALDFESCSFCPLVL